MANKTIAYMVGTFPAITETFVIRELNYLRDSGFEVYVFAVRRADHPARAGSLCRPELIDRCTYARPDNIVHHILSNLNAVMVHPVRYFRTLGLFVREWYRMEPPAALTTLYHFFCGIGFTQALRKRGINHIHAHFAAGCSMALAASQYIGIPFSFTAHASGDIFVKPLLLESKIRESKFVVAVSRYSAAYVDGITGRKYSNKLCYIYNGVSASESESALSMGDGDTINWATGRPVRFISVGSLVGAKGHGTLLEACHILKQRGMKFVCHIIGDGPERADLNRIITKLGLTEEVVITGYLPIASVYSALAHSDVFVLLSEIHANGYRDGFPTVILEAMLASLPVVSTYVSAIPEMVVNGVTGLLVPERDALQAANALEQLAGNLNLRRRYGVAGRKRVLARFDSKMNLQELCSLFIRSTSEYHARAANESQPGREHAPLGESGDDPHMLVT